MKISAFFSISLLAAAAVAQPVIVDKEFKDHFKEDFKLHTKSVIAEKIHEATADMASKIARDSMDLSWQIKMPDFDRMINSEINSKLDLAFQKRFNLPFEYQVRAGNDASAREESFYRRGTGALDNREWDRAAQSFSMAASFAGPRADGALYWKAYSLNKLGRRDEALAALSDLQKAHPSSRWLNDARVLELEIKQSAGRPVSPESESDEELKIYAINSLVHSDPDRALPLLEKILASSSSPRLKERALFVLAQTRVPRALELLTKMAQGGVNPDLQRKAVSYLGDAAGKTALPVMAEIYTSSNDVTLKRAILNVYARHKDKERLLAAATSESTPELRRDGVRYLGSIGAFDELVKLYASASTPEAKTDIIRALGSRGGSDKLVEIIRQEREPKLRVEAIKALGNHENAQTAELLVSIYSSESDPMLRRAVIGALGNQDNGKALVELARKESDMQLKKAMIERLSHMRGKEANDYMMELLSKP